MSNQKGSITISRHSNDTIVIELRDETSRVKFASLEMTPADFAMALTGLAAVPGVLKVSNLKLVGLQKEMESRSTVVEYAGYGTDAKETYIALIEDGLTDGWEMHDSLSSKSSVVPNHDGTVTLNYHVSRWVQKEDE